MTGLDIFWLVERVEAGGDAMSEFCDDLRGVAMARLALTANVAARIAIRDWMQIEVICDALLGLDFVPRE